MSRFHLKSSEIPTDLSLALCGGDNQGKH